MKAKGHFSLPTLLACVLLASLIGACSFTKVPKAAWSEETCPLPPDYSKLENWAAHPDKVDFADKTPTTALRDAQKDSEIDVFYLHPTTLFGKKNWNGDLNDARLNSRTERTAIKHQASIFNGAGRVFVPRYRQMVFGAFFEKEDLKSKGKAFHTAYCDLKAAFATAGAKSALLMRELWNKRVTLALETTTKQGSQFVKLKDASPMVRRMGPLYGKYMADTKTREELLTIIAN